MAIETASLQTGEGKVTAGIHKDSLKQPLARITNPKRKVEIVEITLTPS
jgi:hypothetical protein